MVLVWDTLYGIDDQLRPHRQMVEAEEVSPDELVWTFRLRPGLKFHDGELVLAKDVVASLNRWAVRDSLGQMIKATEHELAAIDDRTFRWTLSRPFRKMLLALGKTAPLGCFIMPARVAATDPFRQISEHVGSGPMRFIENEWVPGARAVFERFPGYLSRDEQNSWLAGGKRMLVDRVEWMVIPDPATASAALQSGEVDWWEVPTPDLVPLLKKSRNVTVDIADPLGNIGVFRMNQPHPPFNDVRARRAILMAVNQEDYMRVILGDDDRMWKPMRGFILKGPRDLDGARRLLAQSGYAGQPVTCLVAQDVPYLKAWGDVSADLMKRLGFNVDFVATDFSTVVARRAQKSSRGQGGWQMFHSWHAGMDYATPTPQSIRANGEKAWFGWPNIPTVEVAINAWFEAKTLEEEKAVARALNKAALADVVYAPLGFFLSYQAWRKNVTGIVKGPLPFFWGVNKTA
jgi:peptide/nickel transport system substrate-binding protein